MRHKIINAMSVDVEDYFQVSAFETHISRDQWENIPCRIECNIERILLLFEKKNVKATFFILGWIAERYTRLIHDIVAADHEIASHGYDHIRVTNQDKTAFREDIVRTKALLEDICSVAVSGYRAPSYSIGASNLWAVDVIKEAGYQYSSSIYPIRHDLYGMPEAPRFAFRHQHNNLLEVPISTVTLFKRNFPCGGGGYFRLFPYKLSRWAIAHLNRKEDQPAVFYFHPWEIDPKQPRQKGIGLKTQIRHYVNLHRMESRLRALIEDFSWDRIDRIFAHHLGHSYEHGNEEYGNSRQLAV